MSAQRNEEMKKLLTALDKICQQQKLIELKITQADRRLFRSAVEGNDTFLIHILTQRSVLEGIAKTLAKAKQDVDRKIEDLIQADLNLEDSLNQSLDSSVSYSNWGQSQLPNLSSDAFAGYATELFSSYRNS